jgi:hypothetical protein
MRVKKLWLTLGALGLLLAVAPVSQAQLNSNVATVNLNAVLGESLTVSAAPGLVNFALVGAGVSNGSAQVSVDTTWSLATTRTSVGVYAYFSNNAAALTDGAGNNIPSANVSGSVNGGAWTVFTGASPFSANASVTLGSQAIGAGNYSGMRNDTLDLRIDTTGLGLPAAIYTGVLNIQAQAL